MIAKSLFGVTPDGREVYNYTFTDSSGQSAVITEYGCRIVELNIRDTAGNLRDVALGYDTLSEYLADTRSFGATVGRYANRIANGRFSLNGVTYHLPVNSGPNTLHGGNGFHKRLFTSEVSGDEVIFRLESPHLDQGFPGNFSLAQHTTFRDGALRMVYEYSCDMDCPANITNHNYFNLNGHGRGMILNHRVCINADRYCQADDNILALAPTASVEGTPFDFRGKPMIISKMIPQSQEIIRARGGFDHCFEIKRNDYPAATVTGDLSGITLTISTDMPAIQFYTGNSIGHCRGKGGAFYNNYDGFALECQQFPNAINEPSFPDCVVKAGQPVKVFIEYAFSIGRGRY